jgi:hypothetical protein
MNPNDDGPPELPAGRMFAAPTTFVSASRDVDASRAIRASLLASGLPAFLVETHHSDRAHRTP